MNTCNVFQCVPDCEVSCALSSFNLLIVHKAYPQPVRRLLLSKPGGVAGGF